MRDPRLCCLIFAVVFCYLFATESAKKLTLKYKLINYITDYNDSRYMIFSAGITHYNRTWRIYNHTITIKKPLTVLYVTTKLYQYINNRYHALPVDFTVTLDDIISSSTFNYNTCFTKETTPPITSTRGMKVDVPYHMLGCVANIQTFPGLMPAGNYRFLQILSVPEKKSIVSLSLYGELYNAYE